MRYGSMRNPQQPVVRATPEPMFRQPQDFELYEPVATSERRAAEQGYERMDELLLLRTAHDAGLALPRSVSGGYS